MSLWKELSTEQLYKILECKNIAKLHKLFIILAEEHHEYDFDAAMIKIRKKYSHALTRYQIMQSIFSVLNNEASYPWIVALAFAQAVLLATLTLSLLTAGAAIISLATGIFFFRSAYLEYKMEAQENQDELDFTHIKLECAKEIIHRHQVEQPASNEEHAEVQHKPFIKPFVFESGNRVRRLKSAYTATLLTASSLLAIYYLTAAVVIAAFSVTTALLGPIGIGVAVGVALIIGIYAGYKQYQSLYNNEKLEAYKAHHSAQLEKKLETCDELRGIPKQNKLYTSQQNENRYAGRKSQKQAYFDASFTLQRRNFMNKKPSNPQTATAHSNHIRPK